MECPKSACRSVKTRYEVHHNVVEEDPQGRKWNISQGVCYCDSRWSVKAIVGLKKMSLRPDGEPLSRHTCFRKIGLPNIWIGIYRNE
jgi:hypothetical protein